MTHKPRYFRKSVTFAVFLLLTCALASCASSGISLFKLVAAQGEASSADILDGQVILSARYLDAGERYTYLMNRGYESLGQGLRTVSMVTFALTVENRSAQKLILDPASVRLNVGYGPLLSPYTYVHLYLELPRESDRPKTLADLRKAIFERSETLAPGEAWEKLLLFARPEKVSPLAALYFERLYLGGRETRAELNFKAVDLER